MIGRAGIKIPFLERKDNLIVKQISVDIKTNGYVPTLDFIGVDIDAVAKIRVKTDEEGIKLAMRNFLNMREEEIIHALIDSLQGNMREIIGTVKLKELCNDRKKFGDEVQEKAQKDMNALGIEIISCNIQRIDDEKGLIIALGQDNMSQIQKDAEAKKFEMERNAEAIRINADAVKYQAEQEAEAIRAKVLPEVAANVAKPLENVDKITMYGEGNTAKLVEDITKATTQVSTGLTEGLGFDLKSVLAGALGTKVLEGAKTEKGAEQ